MSVRTYTGSCHCGAIRFETELDLSAESKRCNCSYCAKVRAWFAFAKGAESMRLLEDRGVSVYRWTPPGFSEPHLTYTFCRVCGVRTYASGAVEALGGPFYAISVPTLDLTDEERVALPVRYINGRDGRYDEVPAQLSAI